MLNGRSKRVDRAAAARSTPHSTRRLIVWGRVVLAAAAVAAIMAISGAFGSGAMSMVGRATYFLFLFASGAGMGVWVAGRVVPDAWYDNRRWLAGAAIVAMISPPITVLVTLSSALMRHRALHPFSLLEDFPSTVATTAAMTGLAFLLQPASPSAETHAGPVGAPPPKFFDRLPERLRGADLLAVQAEDHYLRLHTSLGQDLILMRLGDAIAELEGIEGAQTHRSWWVARAAVKAADRADGRATLTLEGGLQAPVSRAYAKGLRDAGWF